MDFEALDDFSRRFTEALLVAHPEWRSKMKSVPSKDGGTDYLVVDFRDLGSALDTELPITTYDDEITISFGHYHCHSDWSSDDPAPSWQTDAMAFIEALLNEEIVAVSRWVGDKWAGSQIAEKSEIHRIRMASPDTTMIRTRSWKGTYSEDREVSFR